MAALDLSLRLAQRPDLIVPWLKDFLSAALIRNERSDIDLHSATLSGKLDDWGIDSLLSTTIASELYLALDCEASGALDHAWPDSDWASWISFVGVALDAPPQAIEFTSSGSTGSPTTHRHSYGWLVQEMRDFSIQLDQIQRVVSTVPAHHIYGFLFSVILPGLLGVPRIDALKMPPAAISSHGQPGDLWISHPFWLQNFLNSGRKLPSRITLISSTQQLPEPSLGELVQRGAQRVIEIYGASETAGIGWRDQPGPFQLFDRWTLQPGGRLADGYSSERSIALPDRIEWLDQSHFRVNGRADRVVKVGGERVNLDHVEAHIRQFPGLTEVRVRLADGPMPRLKALVVPQTLADQVEQLRRHVACLSAASRPQAWSFADSTPRSTMAKDLDWDR